MKVWIVALLLAALAACSLEGAAEPGVAAPPTIGLKGNGIRLNGIRLNGIRLNGVQLGGADLNGVRLKGVRLVGSQLLATDGTTTLTGAMMIGSALRGLLADGTTVTLRIDDAHPLRAPNQDVWTYNLSFEDSGSWFPVCGTSSSGAPVGAIAVAGLWDYGEGVAGGGAHHDDPTAFTLACRGVGAIAKCVEMGYKPWLPSVTAQVCGAECSTQWLDDGTPVTTCINRCRSLPISYADYHEACTRMVRADYCGDGLSHTVDGTQIDVYDGLGVQVDTEDWNPEAEWGTSGARCYAPEMLTANRQRTPPACTERAVTGFPDTLDGCGDPTHFVTRGTLLIDETLPVLR